MTEKQIKAIAYKYARLFCGDTLYFDMGYMEIPAKTEFDYACSVLDFLNERYYLVKKEKAMELYDCFFQNIRASRKLGLTHAEDIAKGSCATMRDIFGTSMFSQNEK